MELKDVNNALASLLNFGKPSASATSASSSAPMVGEGFADLLKGGPKTEAPQVKDTRDVKENKPAARDDKKVRADDKVADNKKANNKKTDNNKNQNAVRNENTSADASASNADKSTVNKTDKTIKTEKTVETQAANEALVSEEAVVTGEALAPVEGAVVADDGAEVADDLSAYVVPLDVLAMMGTINVVNVQTGETKTMTGAELAAQLSQDADLTAIQLPVDGENTIQLVPAMPVEQVKAPEEGKIDISAMDLVDDGEVVNLNMAASTQTKKNDMPKAADSAIVAEDFAEDKNGEKVSKLAEVVGEKSKVEVKVNSREEKIAHLSAKDLVADAQAVDEAVAKAANQTSAAPKTGDGAQANQMQNNGNLNPALNLNAAAAVSATPVAQATEAMGSTVSAQPVEISSAALSNVSAHGSEFVKAAKADAAGESSASFKDVYKGMSKEVAEQVRVNITKSAVKGVDKIEITLKPQDLGHIEVKMQIGKDGKLQAHLISSRPETMEALQKEMQSLEKAFNDAGFQTDEGSLSFSFREGNHANQNQERENGLRNFIGDVFEKEASNDILNGDLFQNQSWDGTSGLNIRV